MQKEWYSNKLCGKARSSKGKKEILSLATVSFAGRRASYRRSAVRFSRRDVVLAVHLTITKKNEICVSKETDDTVQSNSACTLLFLNIYHVSMFYCDIGVIIGRVRYRRKACWLVVQGVFFLKKKHLVACSQSYGSGTPRKLGDRWLWPPPRLGSKLSYVTS